MDVSVQVRQRGTMALPADLREKYGIQPGDTYHLVDLDGVFDAYGDTGARTGE